MIKFSGLFVDPKSSLGYCGVSVPDKIMKQVQALENKRFIITLNNRITFPGTPVPVEKGQYLVLVNKARQKQLKNEILSPIHVEMIVDESEFGMPMPEEFQEVMSEDPEGEAYLRDLSPGKIRSLLYIVGKVKNQDKRIEKSVVIFEHLKANKGQLDMRMLNVAFKEYNKL